MNRILAGVFLLLVMGAFTGCQQASQNPSGVRGQVSAHDSLAVPPSRGTVEVLNGTTLRGVGVAVAEKLRLNGFDVVKIGNAPAKNFPRTLVVQRRPGATVSDEVAHLLGLSRATPYNNENLLVDATVFVGRDIQEILNP